MASGIRFNVGSASTTNSGSGGAGCLTIFALPFAAVGTWAAYTVVSTLFMTLLMQSWPTTAGQIVSLEFVGNLEGSSSGYVKATYAYDVAGTQFEGKRVSLYTADNVGTFHRDNYHFLKGKFDYKQSIPVHYNSNDPNDSILFPVFRWESLGLLGIFALVFGMVGWGLIVGSWSLLRRSRERAKLAAQFPGQPWLYRADWKSGQIRSSQKGMAMVLTALALFWNAISSPILFILPGELAKGKYVALLLLLFPAIGVGMAYAAGVSLARYRRFGKTFLELVTNPVIPGEGLRGRIISETLVSAPSVELTLICQRSDRIRSGGKTRHETTTVWSVNQEAAIQQGQSTRGKSVINVEFALPTGVVPTSEDPNANPQFAWKLLAKAKLEGADFSAEFDLPVFNKKQSAFSSS